ncbi:MAG: histidine kinase [Gemmatimonadaceae bacterium]
MRPTLKRSVPSDDSIRLAALRVPLALKLVGANVAAIAVVLAAWIATGGSVNTVVAACIVLVIAVQPAAVLVALRPIRDLEIVASRVWDGDFGARVVRSRVADRGVLRVGSMFNLLLDGLVSDRARLRALASEVIAIGDQERTAIAKALHDSTAQHVAALQFQLSVAARETTDPSLRERLAFARDSAELILEEVRSLSYVARPALLDDLGLEAALRKLARDAAAANAFDVDVVAPSSASRLPSTVEALLFRVANEALRNIVRHASATAVRLNLRRAPTFVALEIHDDGAGFEIPGNGETQAGGGLQSLRERIALVDGWLEITTAPGLGTTLVATVPLAT